MGPGRAVVHPVTRISARSYLLISLYCDEATRKIFLSLELNGHERPKTVPK